MCYSLTLTRLKVRSREPTRTNRLVQCMSHCRCRRKSRQKKNKEQRVKSKEQRVKCTVYSAQNTEFRVQIREEEEKKLRYAFRKSESQGA